MYSVLLRHGVFAVIHDEDKQMTSPPLFLLTLSHPHQNWWSSRAWDVNTTRMFTHVTFHRPVGSAVRNVQPSLGLSQNSYIGIRHVGSWVLNFLRRRDLSRENRDASFLFLLMLTISHAWPILPGGRLGSSAFLPAAWSRISGGSSLNHSPLDQTGNPPMIHMNEWLWETHFQMSFSSPT